MDFGQPATLNEAQALIGMVRYYRYLCPRKYCLLEPLTEVDSVPKVRKKLWNDFLEYSFK